ncbi:tRNA (adenosine(37)-N6)-threonylcarbamoyltransferase complex ATPase subunit type 1 TsaE [Tateyamaria omphalii]|uniref:tRNA threonylcarbamoyladenosine biosynthesis protein TsaE n=1 Tax=Tateyamaria omphalii TaxID=299262 RepID=A0A1P8MYE0_9RHOB|nr:tRNA (adenosine(37)-N6)-threonylcarbamoyltransferase complex ATPase subunit type 1 TsaE [Tateyamaria omphalii]APX13096.1 tRNA (adenosine(37)-N6)-threonylcarbamoyltransferase complex ATPase subunit type 1 TsaE [Tateyamaria omphalii]
MTTAPLTLHWPTEDDTARAARAIGANMQPGDVILLEGDVGAGKTHLARALIQSLMTEPEDVPSPTFTLVQIYDTRNGPLWHTDLYRISADTEIDELGLFDAFETAMCLVEWPDRLGMMTPKHALTISIETQGDARSARLSWTDPRWANRLNEVAHSA